MTDPASALRSLGGIASVATLRARGPTRRQIGAAIHTGVILRPRIGWLALAGSPPAAVRAVALGGRLASANALESHGIWVDRVAGLAVHVAASASRLPALRVDERRLWRRLVFPDDALAWRVSVADALLQLGHETDPIAWLCSVESALHRAQVTPRELELVVPQLPAPHRAMLSRADGTAESGNETRLRIVLIDAGLAVESQVRIPLVGRVDLLVEGWLIVEVDSRAHHGSPADQERDRIREGNAVLGGYATVRFMPESVRDAVGWCADVVRARLRQGQPARGSGSARETHRVLP